MKSNALDLLAQETNNLELPLNRINLAFILKIGVLGEKKETRRRFITLSLMLLQAHLARKKVAVAEEEEITEIFCGF